MTVFTVKPTRRALADADEAFLWIFKEAPDASLHWYEGLLEAIKSLSRNPLRCSLAPENLLFKEEIRHLIYGRYRIIFKVREKTVFVLTIRHGARKPLAPDGDE